MVLSITVSDTNLFAGTLDGGIFCSTDNGTNWRAVNAGLTRRDIPALATSGTNLFAGTTNSVWRRPLSELASVEVHSSEVPAGFSLSQNYPNPFNPFTIIKYTVGGTRGEGRWLAVSVKLAVYDLLGRGVAVLVDERKQPGSYEVGFDGSGLASGVYIYRLTAGSSTQARTMVLLK